ncbi:immunity 49 family protein [Nocardiopsis changdeensis]|uniref:Immunity 49 family protein n=1 Tax=Nocardiopsis changdeensis TaxID=2831969 RepID=A0ABX8BK71_9ACTN|nr:MULTISPECIES: immunity 49 family protein [Nocardiopsis]QUX22620.1 immunity 49 family protein [Nocardiopsis changdeensis]QYX38562.1 immunity 49 family protein [Nocardiopsis sp. MT53]
MALQTLSGKPWFLRRRADAVLDTALQELLVDPSASRLETWEAWVFAMQIANAAFQLSEVEPGQEAVLRVDHQERRIQVAQRVPVARPVDWETAFHLAVTCRDHERVRALCRIPVESLRESAARGGSEYLEYTYAWIDTLQTFVTGGPDLVGKLRRSMELCDPQAVPFGAESVALLSFPAMEVFRRLLMGDPEEFVKALVKALEDFKRFYSSPELESRKLPGVVPLSLLSLACLGHDKFRQQDPEFTLGIDSEYLPEHILKRTRHDDFPI